jgi:hypothetical protein
LPTDTARLIKGRGAQGVCAPGTYAVAVDSHPLPGR